MNRLYKKITIIGKEIIIATRVIKFIDGDVRQESFVKDFMFGKIFSGFLWKEIEKDFSPEEDNLKIAREIYDQERTTWVSLTTGVNLNKVFGKSYMKKRRKK